MVHSSPSICAACARRVLAPSTARITRASAATTTTTTTTRLASRALASSASRKPPMTATATPIASISSSSPLTRSQTRLFSSSSSSSQSPPTTTSHQPLPYYALFPKTLAHGPPPEGPFDIDTRALHREFLQLQAASHPDYHHHAAAASSDDPSASSARRKAEALSSHINNAYKTLSHPLSRAQYILSARYGLDLAADEASALTGPTDNELLLQVLDARETIEEASCEEDLDEIRAENDERIQQTLAALAEAFANEDVQAALRATVRLRYWENIKNTIHDWEPDKPVVLQH